MTFLEDRRDRSGARLAAGMWATAAGLYLAIERAAASAFSPTYSYAQNYISDLGVTVCGTIFDGRAMCSPLAWLMNTGLAAQGLLFFGASVAILRSIRSLARWVFLAFATLNGIGNGLIAIFPEDAPQHFNTSLTYHVLGAFLAIVFGNAAALMSGSAFRELGLASFYRWASTALPILAAAALTMLIVARGSGSIGTVPDGVWERISVYTITSWELLTAACLFHRTRSP